MSTNDEVQEYIESLDFTELTNRDYITEALSQKLSKEKLSELDNFIYNMQNFINKICIEIKNNIEYMIETSPVIQTFKQEIQILWNKISPELRNILISSAHIFKFVSCFIINSHQYLINVICDIRKNTIILVSDLFCLVINGLLQPAEA